MARTRKTPRKAPEAAQEAAQEPACATCGHPRIDHRNTPPRECRRLTECTCGDYAVAGSAAEVKARAAAVKAAQEHQQAHADAHR